MPKAYLLRHRFALANLHAMATLLAINTFIGVDIPINEERSKTDMCKAWEDQKEEGRQEGMEKGIELTKQVIRLSVQGHTLEEISEETKIPKEKVQYILE